MDIEPIKTQRDYRRVLKEIEGLMMAKHNTAEGDRLDVLVTLVEAWERKHYPLDLPDQSNRDVFRPPHAIIRPVDNKRHKRGMNSLCRINGSITLC
jgi:HTH-type transcriptional regulator/antitoxin HigA